MKMVSFHEAISLVSSASLLHHLLRFVGNTPFFSRSAANGLGWEFSEKEHKEGWESSSSKGCKTLFYLLRIPYL